MTRNTTFQSIAFLLVLLFHSVIVVGQRTWSNADYVKININSGNPAFPYPQFLEYAEGKTLAKYNAEGVTHADMEKAGREAYEIMSHRCRYDGGTHCGVPYITFNNFVQLGNATLPQGGAEFCSEGDGYMLLAAAIYADQPTFNGLWMWVHDNRLSKVRKYSDGSWLRQGYEINGRLVCRDPEAGIGMPGWNCFANTEVGGGPTHSAADGDYDIAMALLIAYKQWGEFMHHNGMPVMDGDGNPISYKKAAQDFIKALVDTVPYYTANGMQNGYLTGDIGVDGYPKGGNSWGELTNWRTTQTMFGAELREVPSMGGGGGGASYVDYNAPSYFNEFAHWLENEDGEGTPWQINQFKRAEASSDWVAGQLYARGGIASVGKYQISADNSVTFSPFNAGEDFRFAWRHILNYLWHGNPTTTWNPDTHAVEPGGNTFEQNLATRHAEFMKEPRNEGSITCAKMGAAPDPGQPSWSGPAQIRQSYFMEGGIQDASGSNYALGCSAPAAVASEDLSFIADMYRQSELVWDDASGSSNSLTENERYIQSMPKYFHGWFRNLGMLTNTGNLHAPRNMVPKANMKVYMSVDKTYAYQGDQITYTVQYRNYGSADAAGVTVVTELDPNYKFVSANKGGTLSGNKIIWNIGSVTGFKTGGLAVTIDSVQFTVIAKDTLNPRICLTSTVSGNNFEDWVSNEFPNNATYTMERNCVDILTNRSLFINKTANRTGLNPNDVATFTVEFGNKSEGESSWLNGGRDNVRISYGNFYQSGGSPTDFYHLYRFWNDSYEAYINMNNYRVSYFMYDAAAIGLYDAAKNPTGWTFAVDNQNDLDKYGYNPASGPISFTYQKIPQGEDTNGKWNQRLMIRFADVLMAPSTHVYDKLDSQYLLHKGVYGPGFIRARLAANPSTNMLTRVQDDWSFSTDVKETALDGQGTTFTLISPAWANYDDPGYVINNYSRHVCNPTSAANYGRILVEEFDGYTWRRIQGTGPLPGKEAYNVTITDTIPYELEWVGWIDSTALKNDAGEKIKATYTPAANPAAAGYSGIVYWTIPEMLVGETDKLIYQCKARNLGCPTAVNTYYDNVAWIWSDTDSPDSSKVNLMTTCAELPPVIDPQTSLFKTADKTAVETGDAISYELKFINTEGTRIDANCSATTGWQTLGTGTLPAVTANGLSLSGFNYFFAPEKSYGKDGSVYATIGGNPSVTQELYIVFRYVSGTPGEPDFRGICMRMIVNQTGTNKFGYELFNNGTLVASEGLNWDDVIQFPGNSNAPMFKFVLNGDHLYMYINDAEDEWTNVAKDWSGLTSAGPGHFGMYVNSNGNSNTVLSSFITELDYAFDITLFDNLPVELGNVTNISNGGVWNETKKQIAWPTMATTTATAMAPNDSVTYTFEAEVLSCDNFINNYGLATVYGLDTLKVLNTVKCGTQCLLSGAILSTILLNSCSSDSSVLRVLPSPAGNYTYEYYHSGTPLTADSTSDTLIVTQSGEYYVIVRDANDPANCYVETAPIYLTPPLPFPHLDLGSDTAACAGSTITLDAGAGFSSYTWNTGATTRTIDVTAEGDYSVTATRGSCSLSDTVAVTFGSASLPSNGFTLNGHTVLNRTDSICANTTAELTTTHPTDVGTQYTWTSTPVDPSMVAGGATLSISPRETTTYYVHLVQGCRAVDSITVHIARPMKVEVVSDTLCGSVLLAASATTPATTFEWIFEGTTATGATLTLDNSNTVSGQGTVTVTATSSAGCASEPQEVTYKIPTLNVVINGSPSVCPGGSTTLTAIPQSNEDTPAFSIQWYNADTPIAGGTDLILSNATPGTYRVKVKTAYCEEEATHTLAEGSGEISGTLTINGEEIIGNPRIYGSCGEELVIRADYVSDDGIFHWSSSPADASLTAISGSTITVQPAADTQYFLEFENRCTAYDTIRIELKPQASLTVSQTKACGKTILAATPNEDIFNAIFTWTVNGTEQSQTGNKIEITENAEVKATVRSEAYCPSEAFTIHSTIDTLSVEISGVSPVCSGQSVTLTSTIATTVIQTPQYQWFKRPAGSSLAFEEISGATAGSYMNPSQTASTEYRVTVTAGECTAEGTAEVEILAAGSSGTITADGNTASLVNGTKTYKTCGLAPIALAATHANTDESSFSWSAHPADSTMSAVTGKAISVQPAQHTKYIVQYENNCILSDTIIIEVYPLAVSADWSEFEKTECEGQTLTATLTLSGYDAGVSGSYIRWYREKGGNEEELTLHAGQSSLVIQSSSEEESGNYRYEVSNGVCVMPQNPDIQPLEVKPAVRFTLPQTEYTVIRGEGVTLQATGIQPEDAVITWTDGVITHTANPAEISGITRDQIWTVKAGGENYCETSAEVSIRVDARITVDIALKDNTDRICRGTGITLSADTSGTGKLLNPESYKIVWLKEENGSYIPTGENETSLTLTPDATARYRVEVTYGSQQVSSREITVEVFAPATYDLTRSPVTCSGDEITIGIENLEPADATVKWDDDATIVSGNLNALQVTVRPETGTGKTYGFSIDQQGRCMERGELTVGIEHPVDLSLSADTAVCEGEQVVLSVRAPAGTGFRWERASDGAPAGTGAFLEVAPKESDTYTVTVIANGACPPVTGSVFVEVAPAPVITEIRLLRVREVEILTEPDVGSYPFLYRIDREEYTRENRLNARYYGVHTYSVMDANGCKSEREYTISAPEIIPPVVFTPDGDGNNDLWEVPELAEAFPNARITIFDRFGKRLVEMSAEQGAWNGTYLGNPLPATDYWYEINVEEIDKTYSGHFTLLRR